MRCAEWADGDGVAPHYGYGNDAPKIATEAQEEIQFCTLTTVSGEPSLRSSVCDTRRISGHCLSDATASPRASRFESPQLHQEVGASDGRFRLPGVLRSLNGLAGAPGARFRCQAMYTVNWSSTPTEPSRRRSSTSGTHETASSIKSRAFASATEEATVRRPSRHLLLRHRSGSRE